MVKLFNPCGAATWLLTEIEPEDHAVAWGLCDLGMGFPEFGTVSLAELWAYRGRFGLGIERDLHFQADKPISAHLEEAHRSGVSRLDAETRRGRRPPASCDASIYG